MKLPKIVLIFLTALMFSTSCENGFLSDFQNQDKKNTEIEYQLDDFHKLVIEDDFDIELVSDSVDKIFFLGLKKDLENHEVILENSTLTVRNKVSSGIFNTNYDRVRVKIHFQKLDTIINYGQSYFFSSDTLKFDKMLFDIFSAIAETDVIINCNTFIIRLRNISGTTGNFMICGKADYFYIYNHGTSHVCANLLKAENARVWQLSTGNVFIRVNNELRYKIESTGNIYYCGNPMEFANDGVFGKGQLINQVCED